MTPGKYFKRNRWRVLVPTECLKNRNFGDIMLENRYQIEQKIKTTIIQTGHKSIHKKFPENPDRHFSIDISKFFLLHSYCIKYYCSYYQMHCVKLFSETNSGMFPKFSSDITPKFFFKNSFIDSLTGFLNPLTPSDLF